MDNQKINLPPLQRDGKNYSLIIPHDVERKIRYLCNKISNIEWSGVLFYTYSGTYEDNTLELKCIDIFPMDIGSGTYTEFNMSPDVIAYIASHPELLDCQMGLIHSHHTMKTFFSGTDTDTLRKEGNDRNHFLSLIVNNDGDYTAAITRKAIVRSVITASFTYRTFDDIEKSGNECLEEEAEVIKYNYLDIIKEGFIATEFDEINSRLEIIRTNKSTNKLPKVILPFNPTKKEFKEIDIPKHKSLFDDSLIEKDLNDFSSINSNNFNVSIPASLVNSIVLQLITGSIVISDTSKIDPTKWADQMVNLFDKRFGEDMTLFEVWADTMVEFIVTNFTPPEYYNYENEYIAQLSEYVFMSLDKLPKNKYITAIQNSLLIWMNNN